MTRLSLAKTLVQVSDLITGQWQGMPWHRRWSDFLTQLLGLTLDKIWLDRQKYLTCFRLKVFVEQQCAPNLLEKELSAFK